MGDAVVLAAATATLPTVPGDAFELFAQLRKARDHRAPEQRRIHAVLVTDREVAIAGRLPEN
ncbi:hypothetical protein [Microbacterium sp. PRC9]|uniref:hypothetical protein n=1 Tax=Microbacterium sp. PRC9 TaxID=2962591 RepID=UPI002881C1C9|nr:hypothetical protein [Microbacterium sp. PRC9]MDT0141321.1 hypothetical protein [Microbacterium sp. PRC9]